MRAFFPTLALLLAVTSAPSVEARSSYCDKVRARANGQAALLIAPRLFGSGLRFPWPTEQPNASRAYQVRIGLAVSPLDAYRGVRLMDASDADCEAQERREDLQRLLDAGTDGPVLAAHRAQAAYLEIHQPQWAALLDRAEQRFSARVITTLELEELHRKTDALARKLTRARGLCAQLQARGVEPQSARLDELASGYLDAELRAEERASSLKDLDAWGFKLSGGVIPQPNGSVDWFGSAELSYSLGGPFVQSGEGSYLRARREELETARYELPARLKVLKADIEAQLSAAVQELAILDRELTFLTNTLRVLGASEAVSSQQIQDDLVVEQLSAESDRVYLQTLIATLTAMRGGIHD